MLTYIFVFLDRKSSTRKTPSQQFATKVPRMIFRCSTPKKRPITADNEDEISNQRV